MQVFASGGGTGTGKRPALRRSAGAQYLIDIIGRYTLPSKQFLNTWMAGKLRKDGFHPYG